MTWTTGYQLDWRGPGAAHKLSLIFYLALDLLMVVCYTVIVWLLNNKIIKEN